MKTAEWIGRIAGFLFTFLIAYIYVTPHEVHEWAFWIVITGGIGFMMSELFAKIAQAIYLIITK